jgi:hypothetical protein
MARYSFTANGLQLEVMARSLDHARSLLLATLPQSDIDWQSLREAD